MASIPAQADVILDRFVSATNVEDMLQSLQLIVDGFKNASQTHTPTNPDETPPLPWESKWIWQHEEVAEHLVHILQHGQLKANNVQLAAQSTDDAVNLILQLYQNYLAKDSQALQQPSPGRLLEALLDVMDSRKGDTAASTSPTFNTYTRVLALQILEQVSQKHSSLANAQWMQAPNALHRLADTLTLDLENPMEEVVRNQALQVTLLLAKNSSSMAKIFLFAEVESKLLDMSWHLYGGLTKGNPVVLDVLLLIQELAKHADASLQELIWGQRPSVGPRLAQLLDLRGGYEFLNPNDRSLRTQQQKQQSKDASKASSSTSASTSSSTAPKRKLGPLSQKPLEDDDEDDLDNLLSGGASASAKMPLSSTGKDSSATTETKASTKDTLPRLLPTEEKVVSTVLDIIDLLLDSEAVRPMVWQQHGGLCSMVWELGLMYHPAQSEATDAPTPPCALPSAALQQKALELVAHKIGDPATMDRHNGLDRLLRLVCTGGGGGITQVLDERMGLSQASLAVLRNVLNKDRIHDILLHTIAPPPVEVGVDGEDSDIPPPGPTVVEKLWNTVAENLSKVIPTEADSSTPSLDFTADETLFLSGALGGLGVFLADAESREMVFKVTPPGTDLEHMLEVLALLATKAKSSSANSDIVVFSLYRFLCQYIYDTPRLVQTLLSSTASTHLASLATTFHSVKGTLPMVYLLLGLSMEYFPSNVSECGGWTPQSILELLQTIGISKVTKVLEGLKKPDQAKALPWSVCDLEAKHWAQWYQQAVWSVRKRIVRELAGNSDLGDDGDETDGEGDADQVTSATIKPLQKLIAQQTTELDELQVQLEKAQAQIASQDQQLATWQKRMASNPTELDTMLNDFTTQTADLEQEIASLKKEANRSQEAHSQEVTFLKEEIESNKEEATKANASAHEAEQDRGRMEQELQALSQAYASLEEEYRTSAAASSAGQGPGTPQKAPGDPASGFVGSPSGSNELSTLRAMNDRLRNDAKAADDWMAMAVQRMNEMGAHTEQLQQEVSSLQGQLATAQSNAAATANVQEQQLRQEIATLSQQGIAYQQEIASVKSQLDQEQTQATSLAEKVGDLEHRDQALSQDLATAQANLAQEYQTSAGLREELRVREDLKANEMAGLAQQRLELENDKSDLQRRLDEALLSSYPSAPSGEGDVSLLDNLRQEMVAKSKEIEELKSELETTKESLAALNLNETALNAAALNSSPANVQQQLEAAKKEVEETRHRSQEDIYKKEATIRQLEDRLNSGLGAYSVEDIRERDEEIEELRAANEAAQEWMSKAVGHSQLQQAQIAKLSEEKAELVAAQAPTSTVPEGASEATGGELVLQELEAKKVELTELRQTLEQREAQLQELRSAQESSQGIQQDIGIAKDEVLVMKRQLEDIQAKNRSLERQLEGNSLYQDNKSLQQSNEDLERQLGEFRAWADTAQGKIAEIMGENERYKKEIEAARESLLAKAIEHKEDGAGIETAADHSVIEQLKADMESVEKQNAALSTERDTLLQKSEELEKNYNELQAWTEGAQGKLLELASIKSELDRKIIDLEDEVAKAKSGSVQGPVAPLEAEDPPTKEPETPVPTAEALIEDTLEQSAVIDDLTEKLRLKSEELAAAQEALTGDEDVVRLWQDRVDELEAEIDSLRIQAQAQEDEANSAIQQWQETCTEAENRCSALEAEINSIKTHANGRTVEMPTPEGSEDQRQEDDPGANASEHLQEWQDRVDDLQAEVDSLQTQAQEQEDDATSAIQQWQDACNAAENRCAALEEELEYLKKQITTQAETAPTVESTVESQGNEATALFSSESADDANDAADFFSQAEAAPKSTNAAEETPDDALAFDKESKLESLEAKVVELTSQLNDAQQELIEQDERAHTSLNEWQSSHAEVEAKADKLSKELESVLEEKQTLSTKLDVLEAQQDSGQLQSAEQSNVKHSGRQKDDEIVTLKESLSQAEEVVQQWEERVAELEGDVEALQDQLSQQQSDADNAIAQWQDNSASLEERCTELEGELAALREATSSTGGSPEPDSDPSKLRAKIETAEVALQTALQQKDSFEQEIKKLMSERMLEEQAHEGQDGLASRLQDCETEIASLRETVDQDEQVVKQWEERVSELESTIEELQSQLESQAQEANMVISQWQTTCSELEQNCAQLNEDIVDRDIKLQTALDNLETSQTELEELKSAESNAPNLSKEKAELKEKLAAESLKYANAVSEIDTLVASVETLNSTIEEQRLESEEVIGEWTERVEELEKELGQSAEQLAQQEEEANDAISSWAAKADELESELENVAEELLQSVTRVDTQNQAISDHIAQIDSLTQELAAKSSTNGNMEAAAREVTDAHAKIMELEANIVVLKQELKERDVALKEIKGDYSKLREIQLSKSKGNLEEERDRLTVVIAQLEEELTEANNLVQAYITDGSAERATELAADALRDEIDDLRTRTFDLRHALDQEVHAKQVAEAENERLHDDIAALVSLNEDENQSDEIRQKTAKAVERLKMKERIEIEQIRKSLFRSIEELEIARAAEREAHEKLSKIRLQTAVGEQEIIAAKSEISFLSQALEEQRLNEEGKRASLEYRIGSLEDENDVLRRYHSMELESLRTELQQLGMEKDRILNKLKESEKTNASLVLAASKAEANFEDDLDDPKVEIAKLKIENAHLLTVAADDKARAERRLREALAAHRATSEADTILEQELRIAAEATIQNLKLELKELRNSKRPDIGSRENSSAHTNLEKLSKEADALKDELKKMRDENAFLKDKLEHASAKAKSEISVLTEECRHAQAKAHTLERDSQFDVAVRNELEKLRRSPDKRSTGVDDWMMVGKSSSEGREDIVGENRDEAPMISAEAYDFIRKQKEEMQEERKMYMEFLAEHDDLLALLAQHDLERTCLKNALIEAAGTSTLEAVLKEAEERALGQFGNLIKVS